MRGIPYTSLSQLHVRQAATPAHSQRRERERQSDGRRCVLTGSFACLPGCRYDVASWEFSNCAELQVIAPVESFHRKKQALGQHERGTTTQAFWNGNSTPNAPPTPSAAASSPAATAGGDVAQSSSAAASAPSSSSSSGGLSASPAASPSPSPSSPSTGLPRYFASSRPRSTFLQRYLRRHGPSVHHVAFLVPDLKRAKTRFQSFGYTVYGWSDRDPMWKECMNTRAATAMRG